MFETDEIIIPFKSVNLVTIDVANNKYQVQSRGAMYLFTDWGQLEEYRRWVKSDWQRR